MRPGPQRWAGRQHTRPHAKSWSDWRRHCL